MMFGVRRLRQLMPTFLIILLFSSYIPLQIPTTRAASGHAHAAGTWGDDIYQIVDLTVSSTTPKEGDLLKVTVVAEGNASGINHGIGPGIEDLWIGLIWGVSEVVSFDPPFYSNASGTNQGYATSTGVRWVDRGWKGLYPSPSTFTVTFRLGAPAVVRDSYNTILIPGVYSTFGIMTVPSSLAIVYLNPEIITIEADGSITPQDAPIERSGNNYALQSDISKIIQVYRNNAVLDGANHKISNVQGLAAISLKAHGVTIRNFNITDCTYGIRQQLSSRSLIENNNIYKTDFPIKLENSTSSTIINNKIERASHGILLDYSTNNTITLNNSTQCVAAGILLQFSHGNIVNQNTLKDNTLEGIAVAFSNGNQIIGNQVYNTEKRLGGITLAESSSNIVSGNIVSSASPGVNLMNEKYDAIYGNIINNCSFGIDLKSGSHFNKISFNALNDNSRYGISLFESNNNNIFSNTLKLTNNLDTPSFAIELVNSTNNVVYSNTLAVYQIAFLIALGANNRIYNNRILNLSPIVVVEKTFYLNWDNFYPTGGNYWGDYIGNDMYGGYAQDVAGSDGFGDQPYAINAFNSTDLGPEHAIKAYDQYPLMNEYNNPTITKVSVNGKEEVITIVTKTSILQVASTANVLNFTVSGPSGGKGYARITCPKCNTTALRVYMDKASLDSKITSDETNYYIYFEFSLSTHQITLPFTEVVPEGMVSVKFIFDKVSKPNDVNSSNPDTRDLAVAFDYIEFLDANKSVVSKIDVGTDEARQFLQTGWSYNQGTWGTAADYVWAGGIDKTATVYAQQPSSGVFLRIKIRPVMSGNPMRVFFEGNLTGTITPSVGWAEYDFAVPAPTPSPTPTPTATPPPSQNLIVNPGFENGLSGWSTSQGSAVYASDSSTFHSGNNAVKGVENNTGSLGRLFQNVTNITSIGSQYQISGWIKTSNLTGYAVIALNYVDSGGWTPADGNVNTTGYVTGTQNWTFFQSPVFTLPTMPSDTKALWFLFDFHGGAGTAWWDDVSLVMVPTSPSPSPTPTTTPIPTPTQTPSPTPSSTPSPTPSPSPTPTATPAPTPSPSPAPTPTAAPTPTPMPTPTPTPNPTPTPSATPSPTPSPSPMPSQTPTATPTPTAIPSPSPTPTPTIAPTSNPTSTPILTPTITSSPTPVQTPTTAPSAAPTTSQSPTPSPSSFQFGVSVENKNYPINAVSNSSISDLTFNPTAKEIDFKVSGQSGTSGYCRISIPTTLIWGELSIYKDGTLLVKNIDYTETKDGTNTILQISYIHSVHNFKIISTEAVPEFQPILLIGLIFTSIIAVALLYRRRYVKEQNK